MFRSTILGLSIAAALAPAATAADGQFNLSCSGTLRSIVPALLRDQTEPYTNVYRIDLAAGKWCSGDCTAQFDFVSVSPTALVLEDKNVDTPRQHDTLNNRISRETGAHSIVAESGIGHSRLAMFWKGQCEKAPFTGFPKPQTKF